MSQGDLFGAAPAQPEPPALVAYERRAAGVVRLGQVVSCWAHFAKHRQHDAAPADLVNACVRALAALYRQRLEGHNVIAGLVADGIDNHPRALTMMLRIQGALNVSLEKCDPVSAVLQVAEARWRSEPGCSTSRTNERR